MNSLYKSFHLPASLSVKVSPPLLLPRPAGGVSLYHWLPLSCVSHLQPARDEISFRILQLISLPMQCEISPHYLLILVEVVTVAHTVLITFQDVFAYWWCDDCFPYMVIQLNSIKPKFVLMLKCRWGVILQKMMVKFRSLATLAKQNQSVSGGSCWCQTGWFHCWSALMWTKTTSISRIYQRMPPPPKKKKRYPVSSSSVKGSKVRMGKLLADNRQSQVSKKRKTLITTKICRASPTLNLQHWSFYRSSPHQNLH